jgi:hypothetical protein
MEELPAGNLSMNDSTSADNVVRSDIFDLWKVGLSIFLECCQIAPSLVITPSPQKNSIAGLLNGLTPQSLMMLLMLWRFSGDIVRIFGVAKSDLI